MEISNLSEHPESIETVARWYFEQWDHKDPHATFNNVIDKVTSQDNRIAFVVHIDGQLAGAGELKKAKNTAYPDYDYWLDGIYVPKTHRGQGISTALVEHAKAQAADLAISAIYLRCEEHLVPLYEALGFNIVCPEDTKFIMEFQSQETS